LITVYSDSTGSRPSFTLIGRCRWAAIAVYAHSIGAISGRPVRRFCRFNGEGLAVYDRLDGCGPPAPPFNPISTVLLYPILSPLSPL